MDWTQAVEEERAALRRIVALLWALAALAECAAGRSPIIRTLALWFLRQAEMVARDFVDGDAPSESMRIVPAGTGPADALRLAISLRALARRLDRQARRLLSTRKPAGGERAQTPSGGMPEPRALACLSWLAAVALGKPQCVGAPDTS